MYNKNLYNDIINDIAIIVKNNINEYYDITPINLTASKRL
jgi:hypothetical protein